MVVSFDKGKKLYVFTPLVTRYYTLVYEDGSSETLFLLKDEKLELGATCKAIYHETRRYDYEKTARHNE